MQGQAGCVVGARTFERAARFDFEHVIAAVAVLVDPSADRITLISRLDCLGPVASIGEDSTIVVVGVDQNIRGIRCYDEFQRLKGDHHARHAARETLGAGGIALSALGLVRHAVLQDLLIFRRQRGLLTESPRLGLIVGRLPPEPRDDEPHPLALPVGVLRIIDDLGAGGRRQQSRQRDCTEQVSVKHGCCPLSERALSSLPRLIEISQIRGRLTQR
jgi:hypothetical protein